MKTPLEGLELPTEHIREYDAVAEHCAFRGLRGAIGDPLPLNMNPQGALRYINADPEAFQERVRQYAYGLAMNRTAWLNSAERLRTVDPTWSVSP